MIVVDQRTFVQGRPAGFGTCGEGMPVVLLHGWALGQHTYREVVEAIAEQGCRVIAPALPGFGGTPELPASSFSLRGYAQWVADLLDAIDVTEPVVMVGHSFGGGVAVRFAHDHKYGPDEWAINPNRRGYFSNAFYGQWVYDPNCKWQMYTEVGYLVKRNVKSGWLEKNSDGTYKTIRHSS